MKQVIMNVKKDLVDVQQNMTQRLNSIEQVSDFILDVWQTNFEGLKES
jgi:coproporphyrinogen III oxidase